MWADYNDMTMAQRKEHDEKFGGYNRLPPHWQEVTERDIVTKLVLDTPPTVVQFRQMRVYENRPLLSATLFFFHDDSGYARAIDYENGRIRWFTFSRCAHQYETVEVRACYVRSRCVRCGYEREADASD